MAQFSDLPTELVEQILSYLTQPAYYPLSQVSRALHKITIPYLYRDLDLLASGFQVPRIDRLFFNILDNPELGNHIQSLRLGVQPDVTLHDVPRCMRKESKAQHQLNYEKAMEFVDQEPLIRHKFDFNEVLFNNDYGAYAALLFLALPALQSISIAENGDEALRPLHSLLTSIIKKLEDDPLLDIKCVKCIKEVTFNFDTNSAIPYPENNQNIVWQALAFPNIEKLEFTLLNDRHEHLLRHPPDRIRHLHVRSQAQLTYLTSLTIRHTRSIAETLRGLLSATPSLRSLTCESCYDLSSNPRNLGPRWRYISLEQWNAELGAVRTTLQTLVISVEFCDGDATFFSQPDINDFFSGRLDLRGFYQLHTLEVPVPFLTGKSLIWIGMDMDYLSVAPPNLRHLVLRTDMTDAQFVYPFDTSIMATGLTLEESTRESRVMNGARMDLSCIMQFAISLIDQLVHLQSFAIWQPPDPSLDLFDNQLEDLRMSCRNKSITAKVIYPMLLRWKSADHWNLVREVTLFNTKHPECGSFARFFRGERQGIPLGLASQYHLGEFRKNRVRRHK